MRGIGADRSSLAREISISREMISSDCWHERAGRACNAGGQADMEGYAHA